jgi:hypothetical protein
MFEMTPSAIVEMIANTNDRCFFLSFSKTRSFSLNDSLVRSTKLGGVVLAVFSAQMPSQIDMKIAKTRNTTTAK